MISITFTQEAMQYIEETMMEYENYPSREARLEEYHKVIRHIHRALDQRQVLADEIKNYFENKES